MALSSEDLMTRSSIRTYLHDLKNSLNLVKNCVELSSDLTQELRQQINDLSQDPSHKSRVDGEIYENLSDLQENSEIVQRHSNRILTLIQRLELEL
ncbi:hypothetical protein K4A83_10935 [Spirulina subsalsa FACHB-351]|uniref:Uncharacterized protein n=1 Tax=Spirulina subsalsa FACHB-351 TaxID=234711 RepID=A0ABT3L5K5_9CYAN|nr:hypothetical protein [Spirulina subsalsa]MCW6036773.1 hypothetical protein [Spirulina subsalsa FACHB-351]